MTCGTDAKTVRFIMYDIEAAENKASMYFGIKLTHCYKGCVRKTKKGAVTGAPNHAVLDKSIERTKRLGVLSLYYDFKWPIRGVMFKFGDCNLSHA